MSAFVTDVADPPTASVPASAVSDSTLTAKPSAISSVLIVPHHDLRQQRDGREMNKTRGAADGEKASESHPRRAGGNRHGVERRNADERADQDEPEGGSRMRIDA